VKIFDNNTNKISTDNFEYILQLYFKKKYNICIYMSYTVFINSNNRTSGTVSNANYVFDWSVFKNSKYKVTWSMIATDVNMYVTDFATVSINLGQSQNFIVQSTTKAMNTNIIGTIIPNDSAISTFLYGDKNTNMPFYLDNRPINNDFNVRIQSAHLLPLDFIDSSSNPIEEYIITLSFEAI
jgi:hypothetical protein